MFILQATNIKKQYGAQTVLDFEGIQVYEGDKIGIVGRNGAGKSTLLGVLSGEIPPDSGEVVRHCETAFIRQLPQREGTLSGGENAKRQIQQQILRSDAIVFADEPTANLDTAGVEWVRGKLQAARTVLLISHDRDLLNAVCNKIVEVRDGALHLTTGTYADYERQMQQQEQRHRQEYEQYRRQKAQLEAAAQQREQKVASQRQKKRRETAKNSSEARLGGHKRAASMKKQERIAKVLAHRIERLEPVDKIREAPKLSIDFSLTAPPGNKLVIRCEDLHFAYGDKPIFCGASFVVKNRAKVAVTGVNGAGKSTLLRLLHTGCYAITCVPKLKPGFLHQSFENLDLQATVLDNVLGSAVQDQAAVRGLLAGLLFRGDDVFKQAGVLSGGEKMRLSLAKLIAGDNNALLLDEPTNYLDIRSLQAVEAVLQAYPGTLLLVSHDRRFVEAVADEELRIENHRVVPVQAQQAANPVQKTLLELRRVQLLGDISAAPLQRKEELEAEYAQVVQELHALE